jgi:tetratricopeptide (TPR) repeat protein
MEGLTLTAMGRYEDALAAFDAKIALGRELGRPVRVLLNYSTMALRELYDLEEAHLRTEEALSQKGWSGFPMPQFNSLVDLVFTDLAAGDVGAAETRWPAVWEEVRQGKAWAGWLLAGKMTAAKAEIALLAGRLDDAVDAATQALAMARHVHRRKYEAVAKSLLGQAMLAMGRVDDAVSELREAVAIADSLGSPPARWQARVALGKALYAAGEDDGAAAAFTEAVEAIRNMAEGLDAHRAEVFLAAEPVLDAFGAAGEPVPDLNASR